MKEYGIWNAKVGEIHREHMTQAEARSWMEEWYEMGGRADVFEIAVRTVSPWTHLPTPPRVTAIDKGAPGR